MPFDYATRVRKIPPYLFAEIEEKVRIKKAQGLDMIDFGIGDPDLPTPQPIIDEMCRAARDPANHKYASGVGEPEMRQAVADFYEKRFGVNLDPNGEVCITLGSKEGLVDITRAYVNPGEKVLCPDPGYPVYAQGAATLCDAIPVRVPLLAKHQFLIEDTPMAMIRDAKMLFVNYPNNPTGAVAPKQHLLGLALWCVETATIMCYDNAYSELTFDDCVAPSILEFNKESCVEFGSLSKTFNMTGYRIGYAVGDAQLITGLKKIKAQVDSGVPKFVQKAGAFALSQYTGRDKPAMVKENIRVYQERRNVLVKGLRDMGFKVDPPQGTFYLWLDVGGSSLKFADKMLNAGVVVTPGVGFGSSGEGYVRMAITQPVSRIEEALVRMKKAINQ